MKELIFQGGAVLIALYWFFIGFNLVYYMIKKYPNQFKSKKVLDFFFSSDINSFWKEVFRSTHKNDKRYTLLLLQFRMILIIFIVVGLIWMVYAT